MQNNCSNNDFFFLNKNKKTGGKEVVLNDDFHGGYVLIFSGSKNYNFKWQLLWQLIS